MKIEIGESLLRSWVRHIRLCQMAELNWKPSPKWTIDGDYGEFFQTARSYFLTRFQLEPFSENVSIDQFFRQAEIDILGIRFESSHAVEIIGVDVAFHSGGLLYGSQTATVERVVKKLFRTALVVDAYIPNVSAELVFAAPKINPGVLEAAKVALNGLNAFFSEQGRGHFKFRLVSNEDFNELVLQPVRNLQSEVADTSELFLRASQLIDMFPRLPNAIPAPLPEESGSEERPIQVIPSVEEFKRRFLGIGRATISIHYKDGRIEKKTWTAVNFSESSSVMGNLRSRAEFRPAAWRAAGISKVVVRIDE